MRQFHGIGIGRTRGDDRPGTREAKTVEQHGMIEKIAGQRGALAQPMLFEQIWRCYRLPQDTANFSSRMSQAMPSCPTSDFRPATASKLAR